MRTVTTWTVLRVDAPRTSSATMPGTAAAVPQITDPATGFSVVHAAVNVVLRTFAIVTNLVRPGLHPNVHGSGVVDTPPPEPPPWDGVTVVAVTAVDAGAGVTVAVAVFVTVGVIVTVFVAVGEGVTVTVVVMVAVLVDVTVGVVVTVRVVVTVAVCVTVGAWVRVGVNEGVVVVVGKLWTGVGVQAHAIWARLSAPGMFNRPAP